MHRQIDSWSVILGLRYVMFSSWFVILGLLLAPAPARSADPEADLKKAAMLYASFDEAVQADRGGSTKLRTRFNHPREQGQFVFEDGFDAKVFRIAMERGVSGGALEVVDVLPMNGRIFFPARGNIAYDAKGWSGAISLWCKTDPNKLFKTKFCDPIQITQKGANNGGIWFDFNDAKPREMRHGAFPAVPDGQKGQAEADPKAPLVVVGKIEWKADEWHHVVLNWSDFDSEKAARSQIYIDGKLAGEIANRRLAMQWDLDKAGIYIAINYIGLLDELVVFNRALTVAEIGQLQKKPGLLK